ncbi:hypothetical protein ACFL6S_17055 [Candidatus Poribacteria bacterium]
MNGKGLNQLPSPVKIFVVSYMVLIVAGLLLSLWLSAKSWSGLGAEDPIKQMEEAGMTEAVEAARSAQFHEYLKRAHIHHLGHIFMVFSVAGIYAFTSGKNNIKIQVIIWTAIVTLVNTLAFLIYSRVLLIAFGGAYGVLMAYMMVVAVIECCRPVRE